MKSRAHDITVRGRACEQIGPVISKARKLTEEWRKKVKAENVRLNRPGLPKVTIKELIERGRERRAGKVGVTVKP